MNIGFEIIVFGQILPHKIGVSDLRSPNSQIQFLYTPNTMPIKDGLTLLLQDRTLHYYYRTGHYTDYYSTGHYTDYYRTGHYTTTTGQDITLLLQYRTLHYYYRTGHYTTTTVQDITLLQDRTLHYYYRTGHYTTTTGQDRTLHYYYST